MTNRIKNAAGMGSAASAAKGGFAEFCHLGMKTVYTFECFSPMGRLKWTEEVPNLVVDQGLNDLLDKYFKGSTYTAAWYVGLIDDDGFIYIQNTDTAAKIVDTEGEIDVPTSNGWAEFPSYSEGSRETLTLGSVSGQSVSNTASKAEYTITSPGTINGAFVVSTSTKGGTAGILYGATSFASPRALEADDTLRVTVTLNATAV